MLVRNSGHISDEFFQFLTSELLRSLKKGLGDTAGLCLFSLSLFHSSFPTENLEHVNKDAYLLTFTASIQNDFQNSLTSADSSVCDIL